MMMIVVLLLMMVAMIMMVLSWLEWIQCVCIDRCIALLSGPVKVHFACLFMLERKCCLLIFYNHLCKCNKILPHESFDINVFNSRI